jgi:hypothetical protein
MVFSARLSIRKPVEAAIESVSLKTENSRKLPAYFLSILLMTLKCQSHQKYLGLHLKEAKESYPSGLVEFLALVIINNRLSAKCSYKVLRTCTSFAARVLRADARCQNIYYSARQWITLQAVPQLSLHLTDIGIVSATFKPSN